MILHVSPKREEEEQYLIKPHVIEEFSYNSRRITNATVGCVDEKSKKDTWYGWSLVNGSCRLAGSTTRQEQWERAIRAISGMAIWRSSLWLKYKVEREYRILRQLILHTFDRERVWSFIMQFSACLNVPTTVKWIDDWPNHALKTWLVASPSRCRCLNPGMWVSNETLTCKLSSDSDMPLGSSSTVVSLHLQKTETSSASEALLDLNRWSD